MPPPLPRSTSQKLAVPAASAESKPEQRSRGDYSAPEELSEADTQAFAAQAFRLGKIPLLPPTLTDCHA